MQQIADMSMTAGDWISLAGLLCGTLVSIAVPVITLLWRISTKMTLLASKFDVLFRDHKDLSRLVHEELADLKPRVTRLETVVDERTDAGGSAGGTRTK